jgi:hypothetical protein
MTTAAPAAPASETAAVQALDPSSAPVPAPEPPYVPDMALLRRLAHRLFVAEAERAAVGRKADAIHKTLLEEWTEANDGLAADGAAPLTPIQLPGEGSVALIPACVAHPIDAKGCKLKLEANGARLRELGLTDVDDTAPTSTVKRPAYLRLTAKL